MVETYPRRYCGLPESPDRTFDPGIDPDRLAMVRRIDRKWVNGTTLRYAFFNAPTDWAGSEAFKNVVHQAFNVWKEVGIGLKFQHVRDIEEAEVRIGFAQDGTSWSFLGREILRHSARQRTMNLGWDITVNGPNGLDTAIHEIGHTLGFPHEHQNPNAGIEWNREAVFAAFGAPPNNWSRPVTEFNVLRKLSPQEHEGSNWDQNSIMHYAFDKGLIRHPREFIDHPLVPREGLSDIDKREVRRFYPPLDESQYEELHLLDPRLLDLEPGKQVNLVIRPTESRDYDIRTFGQVDTVMVLFEGVEDPRFVAGADDSATDQNAQLTVRLTRGREYLLRVRLYWRAPGGKSTLMMW